jgi:hypothetical protein
MPRKHNYPGDNCTCVLVGSHYHEFSDLLIIQPSKESCSYYARSCQKILKGKKSADRDWSPRQGEALPLVFLGRKQELLGFFQPTDRNEGLDR